MDFDRHDSSDDETLGTWLKGTSKKPSKCRPTYFMNHDRTTTGRLALFRVPWLLAFIAGQHRPAIFAATYLIGLLARRPVCSNATPADRFSCLVPRPSCEEKSSGSADRCSEKKTGRERLPGIASHLQPFKSPVCLNSIAARVCALHYASR